MAGFFTDGPEPQSINPAKILADDIAYVKNCYTLGSILVLPFIAVMYVGFLVIKLVVWLLITSVCLMIRARQKKNGVAPAKLQSKQCHSCVEFNPPEGSRMN